MEEKLNQLEDEISAVRTMSGYVRCMECQGFGVPFPHDRVCGNCGKDGCIKLHSEIDVLKVIEQAERKAWEAARHETPKTKELFPSGTSYYEELTYPTFEDWRERRDKEGK